jgi:KaiC/GvpD/RAD55 family RecA-like ATPase
MFSEGSVKSNMLFGQHIVKLNRKVIIITEGEWDAMSAHHMTGYNAVSVPTGASGALKCIRENLTFLEKFDKVFLCFDGDDAGRVAASECLDLLAVNKGYLVSMPDGEDANSMLEKGLIEEFKHLLYDAQPRRLQTLVTGDELHEELWGTFFEERERGGLLTGLEAIDNKGFEMLPGEITTIYGDTSIGKSTFACEIAANVLKAGHSVACFSNEEQYRHYSRKIILRAMGFNIDNVTSYDIEHNRDVISELESRLIMYKGEAYDLETMRENLSEAYRGYGCELSIIDNLTGAYCGQTDIKEAVGQLYNLVKQLNLTHNAHSIIVSHIRRDKELKDGQVPSMHHCYGTGFIERLSDNMIALAKEGNVLLGSCVKRRYNGVLFDFSLQFSLEYRGYHGSTPVYRSNKHAETTTLRKPPHRELRQHNGEERPRAITQSIPDTVKDSTRDVRGNASPEVQPRLSDTVPKRDTVRGSQRSTRQKDYRAVESFKLPTKELFNFICRGQVSQIQQEMRFQYRGLGKEKRNHSV